MRLRLSILVLLFCFSAARAEEPCAVIERAVKAMGLDTDAARRPAIRMKLEFTGWWEGKGTCYYQSPRKLRWETVLEDRNKRVTHLMFALDGNKGWIERDGKISEGSLQELLALEPETTLLLAFSLAVQFSDVESKFSFAADGKWLKSDQKNGLDYILLFDKETGRLSQGGVKAGSSANAFGAWFMYDQGSGRESGAEDPKKSVIAPADALKFLSKQAAEPALIFRARTLVRRLGDERFEVREKAAEQLTNLGISAIAALKPALRDRDPEVVRHARECLAALETSRPDDEVFASAIRQVVAKRSSGSVQTLLAVLPSATEATEREIMAALLVIGRDGDQWDPWLVSALDDPEPEIRAAASGVLGRDGGAYLKQPGCRLYGTSAKLPIMAMAHLGHGHISYQVTDLEYFNAFDPKLFTKP